MMTFPEIGLVAVLAMLALEGLILVAVPNEIRALFSEVSPGVLRAAGVLECLLALVLLAVVFFG